MRQLIEHGLCLMGDKKKYMSKLIMYIILSYKISNNFFHQMRRAHVLWFNRNEVKKQKKEKRNRSSEIVCTVHRNTLKLIVLNAYR